MEQKYGTSDNTMSWETKEGKVLSKNLGYKCELGKLAGTCHSGE